VALAGRSRLAELVLVDGRIGAVVAPGGRLRFALAFRVDGDVITEYEVIADPERLAHLDLALLP
jgi:RNA polymerase sigma-70 factor (ECF subfamily)